MLSTLGKQEDALKYSRVAISIFEKMLEKDSLVDIDECQNKVDANIASKIEMFNK